jgi:hypothetical protein
MHTYLLRVHQATPCGPLALAEQEGRWLAEYELRCQQADEEELPALVFFKNDGRTGYSKRAGGRNSLKRLTGHQAAVLLLDLPGGGLQPDRQLFLAKQLWQVGGVNAAGRPVPCVPCRTQLVWGSSHRVFSTAAGRV